MPATAKAKPKKPYPTFPATPTARGWYKKLNGKSVHVGGLDATPDEVLANIEAKRRELQALTEGRPFTTRHTTAGDLSIRDVMNKWLAVKLALVKAKKLTGNHYLALRRHARAFAKFAGPETLASDLGPDHFRAFALELMAREKDDRDKPIADGEKYAAKYGKTIRAMFADAEEEDWIDRAPKLGKFFTKLTGKTPHVEKKPLPTIAEVRDLAVSVTRKITSLKLQRERDIAPARQLHAMILLGLNGGYGNTDLGELPRDVVDLGRRVIDYRRGKTKADRLVPLWPETVEALRVVLEQRPDDDLVFRTREGRPYVEETPVYNEAGALVDVVTKDSIAQAFDKLIRDLGIKKPGRGFYLLRHVHRTIADEHGDQHAAWRIVGHKLPGMANNYVRVSLGRCRKVSDYVRARVLLGQGGEFGEHDN